MKTLFELITEIIADKVATRRAPELALGREISGRLAECGLTGDEYHAELKRLERGNLIVISRTINDTAFIPVKYPTKPLNFDQNGKNE